MILVAVIVGIYGLVTAAFLFTKEDRKNGRKGSGRHRKGL